MFLLFPFRLSRLACTVAVALLLTAEPASATADGPDFYLVTGIADDDVLNIRSHPDPRAEKLGAIPPDGTCLRNLGCRGGLSFQEFTELSKEEQVVRLKENPRWCRIEYQGITGWVAGRYIREGSCDSNASVRAPDLAQLIGMCGRDGETRLRQMGYSYQGGRKSGFGSLTFYRGPDTGRCLQVVTSDGRYRSLGYVDDSECRSAATATVVVPGKTSLSDKPRADSFRTVCGVIVGKKTHSYLCTVTEIKGDKGVERTALRYPDQEIQLVWGKDKRVDVLFEGLASATPETYSISEGETDLFIGDKTYFYYSDRRMAAWEVEHFNP